MILLSPLPLGVSLVFNRQETLSYAENCKPFLINYFCNRFGIKYVEISRGNISADVFPDDEFYLKQFLTLQDIQSLVGYQLTYTKNIQLACCNELKIFIPLAQ